MKMKCFIVLVALLVSAFASTDKQLWENYKLKFGKVYGRSLEEQTRFTIFSNNLRTIEEHNAKFEAGETTWKMGVNKFADLTPAEFISTLTLNASVLAETVGPASVFSGDSETAPDSIDWREKGAVTPIKDQGNCGGCWSFSTIGTLEGIYYIKTGELLSLSEQNLLDCAGEEYNCFGCDGGIDQYALNYIRDNGGIELESDYPYTGVPGTCQYNSSKMAVTVKGFVDAGRYDEDALKVAVGTIGPISVSLNANLFQLYSSGVFDPEDCPEYINHSVVAVGYAEDYWIFKNSWGTDFGEDGYIRMKFGKNLCSLTSQPCYPAL